MDYLILDTCIILHILRGNDIGKRALVFITSTENEPSLIISSVTKGELESLKIQQNWGNKRSSYLNSFLKNITYIDVGHADDELHNSYAMLDAFSKRKITDKSGNLLSGSAHKMGKNDLWIAATAHILNAPLMTTDGDFNHLNNLFIQIINP